MVSCSYSSLLDHDDDASPCGEATLDPNQKQCITLNECSRDVSAHLKLLKLSNDEALVNEQTLLLARAGM